MAENSGTARNAVEPVKTAGNQRAIASTVGGAVVVFVAGWGIWLAQKLIVFPSALAKWQAFKQTPAWYWLVESGFVVLGLLGAAVLWKVPQWQVAQVKGLNRKERFDRENEARKTVATILGGALLLTGGYFTWRNVQLAQESLKVSRESSATALNISRQGQITDRFTKAIEQLGAEDANGKPRLEVRLGGIYSLEAIAKESRELHWPGHGSTL